jgi:PKD repeat protein
MLSKIREVSWDFGNGYSVKDIDPEYLYTEPGEYILTATATEDNFASCQASKSIPILVRELPNPEIEPLEADSCSPYVYKPKINGDVSYAIDYEDSGIIEANESHTYVNKGLEPIIYKTSIYLEDEYGCKSVKQGLVNVYPEPVASIAIVEVLEERPEVVTFASTSYGADVCRWTFPFAGKLETCKEVKESFYENKTETIYLEVANMYGCVDNDSIDYTPVFKGLYFPNTFSPNGVLEEVRTFNGVGLG